MRKPPFDNRPKTELERAYFTLLSNLPGMVYRCKNDANWTMLFLSEGCKDLTGYTAEELIEKNGGDFNCFINPEDQPRVWQEVQEAVEAEKQYQIEYRIHDKQGKEKWVWERGIALPGRDGEMYLEGFIFDITDKKELEQAMQRMSLSDAVTGLPNKYYILEFLQKLTANFGSNVGVIGVLVIDISGFARINEKHGVKVGDEFLKTFGQVLKNTVGDDLLVGRFQGDQFVVVSASKTYSMVAYEDMAKNILQQVNKKYVIKQHAIDCSARIGIGIYPEHSQDIIMVLQKAEFAAKQAEPKTVNFYDAIEHSYYLHGITMEEDLRMAIETKAIHALYQPIVNMSSGECVGLEALARWDNPKKGSIPPMDFIKLAEKSDLIYDLEDYIFDRIFSEIAGIDFPLDINFKVAINVSSAHIQKRRFRESFSSLLSKYKINPENIAVELTETSISELDKDNENIQYLRKIGCSIIIDDFGSGQSSLSRLYLVPFSRLKIDKYFIENIDYPMYLHLIHSIVDIGKTLEMEAIAEGVETPKQRDYLLSIGCKYAQGYYFSKPLELSKALEFVRRSGRVISA